jgi:hypothetical protein
VGVKIEFALAFARREKAVFVGHETADRRRDRFEPDFQDRPGVHPLLDAVADAMRHPAGDQIMQQAFDEAFHVGSLEEHIQSYYRPLFRHAQNKITAASQIQPMARTRKKTEPNGAIRRKFPPPKESIPSPRHQARRKGGPPKTFP